MAVDRAVVCVKNDSYSCQACAIRALAPISSGVKGGRHFFRQSFCCDNMAEVDRVVVCVKNDRLLMRVTKFVLYVQASVIDPTAYHEISITIYGDMQ